MPPCPPVPRRTIRRSTACGVPPATYGVALIVDGATRRRTARVLADPRLRLAPGELVAQYALARRIQASRIATRDLAKRAKALRARLADQPARAALNALIDPPQDDPPAIGASPWNGMVALSARYDALAKAVDGADAAPSPDARTGADQADAALRSATTQLDRMAAEAR